MWCKARFNAVVSIALILTIMLPTIEPINRMGDLSVAKNCCESCVFLGPPAEASIEAPSQHKVQTDTQPKTTILRGFVIVRKSCIRLLLKKPIVKSESPRHSEMRSGDVSSLRI